MKFTLNNNQTFPYKALKRLGQIQIFWQKWIVAGLNKNLYRFLNFKDEPVVFAIYHTAKVRAHRKNSIDQSSLPNNLTALLVSYWFIGWIFYSNPIGPMF